jgi:hypothetical protein
VIAAVDTQGDLQLYILERIDGWQFGFEIEIDPIESAGTDKCEAD